MDALTDYLAGFGEDPGYLEFAAFGPLSSAVVAESAAQQDLVRRARWGAANRLEGNVGRLRDAVAVLTGFRSDQIAFQPSTARGSRRRSTASRAACSSRGPSTRPSRSRSTAPPRPCRSSPRSGSRATAAA